MPDEKQMLMAALSGDHKKKKTPTHTHGVHYERAHNGGYLAHVHKHHGKGPHSEGHSHTEEHVLPDAEALQAHMDEHMGDQPPVAAGGGGEEMAEGEPPQGGADEQGEMEQAGPQQA
jgi:hypothetical protein